MNPIPHHLTETVEGFLSQCVALAREAYEAGDNPFGSVLVDENDSVLATARNRSSCTSCSGVDRRLYTGRRRTTGPLLPRATT